MNTLTSTFSDAINWMDSKGRKAWIALMIVCFIFAWPLGLALLVFLLWSNRMSKKFFKGKRGFGSLRNTRNSAFENYKAETISRLKQEQKDFESFLERLRAAKDKAEFDQFMEQREKNPTSS
ncbi:MAG: DUF2852 domain-containing protein [Rhodobacteraceae bacterium]|nr:DUF2852 domain-containing protein [Paracoccaceae bacterium]